MGKKTKLAQFLLRTGKFRDLKEVLALLKLGKVRVDGHVVSSGIYEFRPTTKPVTINGEVVNPNIEPLYLMLNKPDGVLCQKNDTRGRPTVWDHLLSKGFPEEKVNSLVTVGRLDIGTEGLLIMTNDGAMVNKILNPDNKIEKEYYAVVKGPVTDDDVRKLETGVDIYIKINGGRKEQFHTSPARIKIYNKNDEQTELTVTICEGKKRQVRNMLLVVGHEVIYLKRMRIGYLVLRDLEVGDFKIMTKEEVSRLG